VNDPEVRVGGLDDHAGRLAVLGRGLARPSREPPVSLGVERLHVTAGRVERVGGDSSHAVAEVDDNREVVRDRDGLPERSLVALACAVYVAVLAEFVPRAEVERRFLDDLGDSVVFVFVECPPVGRPELDPVVGRGVV